MTIFHCHRCLMIFNCNSRLVMHLNKDPQCIIINDKYNDEYDKQLMILVNDFFRNFEEDMIKLKDNIHYQCNLCKYLSPDKYNIKKHLLQSCLHNKYKLNNDLLELIKYSLDPLSWFLQIKSKPNVVYEIDNYQWELYQKYTLLTKNTNNYICKICENSFENKSDIYQHMKDVCMKDVCMNYECEHCLGIFTKVELEEHKLDGCELNFNHGNKLEPDLQLNDIDDKWKLYSGYLTSSKYKGINIFKCKICEDLYEDKESIYTHIINHLDEGASDNFLIEKKNLNLRKFLGKNNNIDKNDHYNKKLAVFNQKIEEIKQILSKPKNVINHLDLHLKF